MAPQPAPGVSAGDAAGTEILIGHRAWMCCDCALAWRRPGFVRPAAPVSVSGKARTVELVTSPSALLDRVSWGLFGSWRSRDTRSGEALSDKFSILENLVMLASDVMQ